LENDDCNAAARQFVVPPSGGTPPALPSSPPAAPRKRLRASARNSAVRSAVCVPFAPLAPFALIGSISCSVPIIIVILILIPIAPTRPPRPRGVDCGSRPPRPRGVGESGPPNLVEKSGTSTAWNPRPHPAPRANASKSADPFNAKGAGGAKGTQAPSRTAGYRAEAQGCGEPFGVASLRDAAQLTGDGSPYPTGEWPAR
jgi:hypothetical protein